MLNILELQNKIIEKALESNIELKELTSKKDLDSVSSGIISFIQFVELNYINPRVAIASFYIYTTAKTISSVQKDNVAKRLDEIRNALLLKSFDYGGTEDKNWVMIKINKEQFANTETLNFIYTTHITLEITL